MVSAYALHQQYSNNLFVGKREAQALRVFLLWAWACRPLAGLAWLGLGRWRCSHGRVVICHVPILGFGLIQKENRKRNSHSIRNLLTSELIRLNKVKVHEHTNDYSFSNLTIYAKSHGDLKRRSRIDFETFFLTYLNNARYCARSTRSSSNKRSIAHNIWLIKTN